MTTGIQQTSEAISAAAGVADDARKAWSDDQEISVWEIAKIIGGNARELITAFVGCSEIPAELADADPDELDQCYWAFIRKFDIPDNTQSRDLFNNDYNGVRSVLAWWRTRQNILNPPKAEVVDEIDIPSDRRDDIGGAEFPSP